MTMMTPYWRAALRDLTHRIAADPAYCLFALFAAGVGVAEIVDLDSGFLEGLSPVEELLETNAGLALLLAEVSTNRPLWHTPARTGTSGT